MSPLHLGYFDRLLSDSIVSVNNTEKHATVDISLERLVKEFKRATRSETEGGSRKLSRFQEMSAAALRAKT